MKRGFADLIIWAVSAIVIIFIALTFLPVIASISTSLGATGDPIAFATQQFGPVVFIAVVAYGAFILLFPR